MQGLPYDALGIIYQSTGLLPGEPARTHVYPIIFDNETEALLLVDDLANGDIERISKYTPGVEKVKGRLGTAIDLVLPNGRVFAFYSVQAFYMQGKQ